MRLIKPYSDVQAGHGAEGRQTSDKLPGSSDSGYGGDDKHQVQSQLGALDTVLNLPPPDSPKRSVKPPHLNMPRYVHHFDTYSMVRNLQTGGFSKEQAIITMKAMRLILTNNMDIAKKGLVDKGSVENVRLFPGPSRQMLIS